MTPARPASSRGQVYCNKRDRYGDRCKRMAVSGNTLCSAHKSASNKAIFCVRAIRRDAKENRFPGTRCWGFFHTLARAKTAVLTNETDLFEQGYYQYAVISKVRPGLGVIADPPEGIIWFESFPEEIKKITHPPMSQDYNWGLM